MTKTKFERQLELQKQDCEHVLRIYDSLPAEWRALVQEHGNLRYFARMYYNRQPINKVKRRFQTVHNAHPTSGGESGETES